jgi:hypothetical protein
MCRVNARERGAAGGAAGASAAAMQDNKGTDLMRRMG